MSAAPAQDDWDSFAPVDVNHGNHTSRRRIRYVLPSYTMAHVALSPRDTRSLAPETNRPVYKPQDTCRSCDGWGHTYLRTGAKQSCRACNGTGLNQRKGA